MYVNELRINNLRKGNRRYSVFAISVLVLGSTNHNRGALVDKIRESFKYHLLMHGFTLVVLHLVTHALCNFFASNIKVKPKMASIFIRNLEVLTNQRMLFIIHCS